MTGRASASTDEGNGGADATPLLDGGSQTAEGGEYREGLAPGDAGTAKGQHSAVEQKLQPLFYRLVSCALLCLDSR